MKRLLIAAVLGLGLCSPAVAQEFRIKPVAEKRLKELPPGPLFWRVENFATLAQAQAAAGPAALPVEVHEKVWLFTLGAQGRLDPRRQQGGRDRTGAPHLRSRVPAAH